jgi:multiple sugar transport system substrate-binding protein
MFEEGKYLPTNKKLYEDVQFISLHEDLNYFKDLYKIGVHRPFLEGYTNISDVLSYYINLAIKGSISVNDALEQVDEKIKAKAILVK